MRIFATSLLGLTLGLLSPAGSVAATPPPQYVLHGGTVWTGTPGKGTAQAIAVRGDTIVAVGSDRQVRSLAGAGTQEIDLHGAFVAPGFTDQHVHTLEQGTTGTLEPEWTGYNAARSEAVRQAIYGYHAATAAGQMTPEDTCSDGPVTDATRQTVLDSQKEMLSQGLTTTVEAGLSDLSYLRTLDALQREGKLRHRFLIRVGWGCLDEAVAAGYGPDWGGPWAKVVGMKLYSDGWLGPRSAALREPYADRPAFSGFLFLSTERARNDVARARGAGFNVTTHAIGDRGLDTMLTAYEQNGVGPADRAQVEHAQVLAPDLIDRMARLGVIASIQLSFATSDMRFAEQALGPERAGRAYAWRTLLDHGVRLAGGSDYPVEEINPLWGIQRIVTRQDFDGAPGPDGWHPSERLTVDEALRLVTSDGAYSRREETERGTLTAGRKADLVVLREDPHALPANCIAAATVLLTMVNGQTSFTGQQAYPPGDASCPSGAAPAKGEALVATTPPKSATQGRPRGAALVSAKLQRGKGRLRTLRYVLRRAAPVRVTLVRPGHRTRVLAVGTRPKGTHRIRLQVPRGSRQAVVRVQVAGRVVRLRLR